MMLSLLATSLLFISADLASARGWRARRRVDVHMGEDIGKAEGVENFTLPSFADFKADFDANLNRDPDFERWLFGGKQSTSTMSDWLRQQRTPWQPWQANNWSTVMARGGCHTCFQANINQASPLKELAASYRSRKTSWMREHLASWQAHLKNRYIAAWYLERMLPRHEALWEAARVCPCRSVLQERADRRCPRGKWIEGSNCWIQQQVDIQQEVDRRIRLAAGYDKGGNPKIRTCYTVPGATLQSDIYQSRSRRPNRNYVEEAEELSCTDRMKYADFLKAKKILLANIRDDKGNSMPATAVASTDPAAAAAAAAATAANNWDWRH